MKKFNTYMVYLESHDEVTKVYIPAQSQKEAELFCQGNGEIIKISKMDKEKDRINTMNTHDIRKVLENACYGKVECDTIERLLSQCGIQD